MHFKHSIIAAYANCQILVILNSVWIDLLFLTVFYSHNNCYYMSIFFVYFWETKSIKIPLNKSDSITCKTTNSSIL